MDKNNFIGEKEWKFNLPDCIIPLEYHGDTDIIVLRSILFFYAGEKTKLSRIKLHFTEVAIQKLFNDKFIKNI